MGEINLGVEILRAKSQGFKEYVKWFEQNRIIPIQQELTRLRGEQVYPDMRDWYERDLLRYEQELATLVSVKIEMEKFSKLLRHQADELEPEVQS